MNRASTCATALVWLGLVAGAAGAGAWPTIAPVHERVRFDNLAPGRDTPVVVGVTDVSGVPRYRLECHNGEYDGRSIIEFSGIFHCAVAAVDGERFTSGNLLAEASREQQRSDWLNRGRFSVHQLRPPCSAYPQYGPTRLFRFRGLALTLRIRDVAWAEAWRATRPCQPRSPSRSPPPRTSRRLRQYPPRRLFTLRRGNAFDPQWLSRSQASSLPSPFVVLPAALNYVSPRTRADLRAAPVWFWGARSHSSRAPGVGGLGLAAVALLPLKRDQREGREGTG